jgi:hypothetical protein
MKIPGACSPASPGQQVATEPMQMSATSTLRTDDRDFKVWEYHVSHGQLLIRSPKAPATDASPERHTNVDLVFLGVEYISLPRLLRGVMLDRASADDLRLLEATLGTAPAPASVRMLVSGGRRFAVVAASVTVSENDWDIFDSPFEFRSQFRGATR